VAGQSLDIGEVRLVKGDSPEPVISGAKPITRRRDDEQVLAFDSTRSPKLSGRTVTANVSYRQLVMRLDTTLSYDDKRLGILLGRDNVIPPESRESQFIKQVFSDFRIQGHGLNEFQWKFDRKCEKGLCPVQATSEPVQIGFARTLNQQWKVTTDWRSQNDNDTFVLKLTDYQLEDADTPDMSSSAAKWTIEGKDTAINFKLKYDLSDTVGLIRVFTAPIDRLTSWQFSSLNRFLYGFLLAILLLWMLWFFEIFSVLTRIRKHFTPAAKWLLLFGISIAFLPAFYYAVQFTTSSLTLRSNKPTPCTNPTLCSLNPLQCTTPTPNLFQRVFMHFVDRCIFESGNDLRLLVITSCLVATAVVVLMVIGHLLLRRGAIAVWSKATLKGIAVAGFFYVAFVLFVGFAQRS
jgi:hypothetical protein